VSDQLPEDWDGGGLDLTTGEPIAASRDATLTERARGFARRASIHGEAFVRLLPHRPALAAALTGAAIGYFNGPLALLAAVGVGAFLLHRQSGFTLPISGPDAVRRTLPFLGRVLVGMFFVLPIVSAGLMLPGFRNPTTIDRYVSIAIAEPSSMFERHTSFPYPGIPLLALAAIALIGFGLWRPRRRTHLIALVVGVVLFIASPVLSSVVNGDPGFHLDPREYAVGMYVALAGVALLVFAQLQGRQPPLTVQGGEAPPTDEVSPPSSLSPPSVLAVAGPAILLAGAFEGQPSTLFGLPFEALHHSIASLIAAGAGAAVGYSTTDQEAEQEHPTVFLSLKFPAGYSPNIFTEGWVFAARCILNPGTDDEVDVSDQVEWSGSGSFSPPVGRTTRPKFAAPGPQTVTLTYRGQGPDVTKEFATNAVDPIGAFASVGTIAACPADAHGCPADPHPTVGPIITGSPTVFIDGRPAARRGDAGVHAVCCGPNMYTIVGGDRSVLIDGRPAARIGSRTQHCGGLGTLVAG